MLLSFPGKGCEHCPFYRRSVKEYGATDHPEWQYCWLHGRTFAGEPPIKINGGSNLFYGEIPTEWPAGCPFGEHYGTLQITAQEGTC